MDAATALVAPAPATRATVAASSAWPAPRRPVAASCGAVRPSLPTSDLVAAAATATSGARAAAAAAAFTAAAVPLAARRRRLRTRRAAQQQQKKTPSWADMPEDFSAIAEYKNLKDNPLVSWGFLEEQEFLVRIFGLFAVNLVIGLGLCFQIYPPSSFSNVVVGGLFGVAIAFSLMFGILLLITRDWDKVNKMLLKKSYVVEARKDNAMGDGGAYAYNQVKTKRDARRDRLLAGYVTDPVVGRLRVYTLAAFALSATTWGGGAVVGGEMSMEQEEEEEMESNLIYTRTTKKMNAEGFGYFLERD